MSSREENRERIIIRREKRRRVEEEGRGKKTTSAFPFSPFRVEMEKRAVELSVRN